MESKDAAQARTRLVIMPLRSPLLQQAAYFPYSCTAQEHFKRHERNKRVDRERTSLVDLCQLSSVRSCRVMRKVVFASPVWPFGPPYMIKTLSMLTVASVVAARVRRQRDFKENMRAREFSFRILDHVCRCNGLASDGCVMS